MTEAGWHPQWAQRSARAIVLTRAAARSAGAEKCENDSSAQRVRLTDVAEQCAQGAQYRIPPRAPAAQRGQTARPHQRPRPLLPTLQGRAGGSGGSQQACGRTASRERVRSHTPPNRGSRVRGALRAALDSRARGDPLRRRKPKHPLWPWAHTRGGNHQIVPRQKVEVGDREPDPFVDLRGCAICRGGEGRCPKYANTKKNRDHRVGVGFPERVRNFYQF